LVTNSNVKESLFIIPLCKKDKAWRGALGPFGGLITGQLMLPASHERKKKEVLSIYTTKIFTTPAICCYTTLWKLKIQKMLLILTA